MFVNLSVYQFPTGYMHNIEVGIVGSCLSKISSNSKIATYIVFLEKWLNSARAQDV